MKSLLIGILISLVAIPTISFGGSFAVSLIQGMTPTEAVQVLAEQIDSLMSRIEIIETNQTEQKQSISNLQATVDQYNIPSTTTVPESEISADEVLRLETLKSEVLKLIVPISTSTMDIE